MQYREEFGVVAMINPLKLSFICIFLFPLSAQATTLFSDNFNSYGSDSQSASASFQAGVTHGTSGWYGARFQNGYGAAINDLRIGCPLCFEFGDVQHAILQDDVGLLLNINTTGYSEVALSFDWRTALTVQGDAFFAGYYEGDLSSEFGSSNIAQFNSLHGPAWFFTDWTQIAAGRVGGGGASVVDYYLPVGVESLWLAFWFNDSRLGAGIECAFGYLDDVHIRGNVVPEPATALLFGIGALGAGMLRRRRFSN